MDELAKRRRAGKNMKYDKDFFPKGILDVIEVNYPDRYLLILEERTRIKTLFSDEEWLDILTKSRHSYERLIKLKKQKNPKQWDID